MNLKKILCMVLSASVIATAVTLPALADYTPSTYDAAEAKQTFDDGEATNAIDGSKAFKASAEMGTDSKGNPAKMYDRIYTTGIDSTKEFYFSFEFCLDSEAGSFRTPSDAKNDNVGMVTDLSGGKLRTQKNSTSYQELGAVTVGQWYKAEIEGKTGAGDANTTFHLYDSAGTLIQETKGLNMRNLSSSGRHFSYLEGHAISVDNVQAIQLYPDTLTISASSDALDAGQTLPLAYTMTRQDKDITKYPVAWKIYDETGITEISDNSVAISAEGVLSADVSCPNKTVIVKASATLGENTLTGEATLTINGIDTTSEPFDRVTLSGDDELKAGGSINLSFAASKDGEDISSSLTASDMVWSIYNCENLYMNNNNAIRIENGTLTVADGVLPQDIYVRLSTPSGKVYGSKKVSIKMSDSQKETVIYSNPCETALDGTNRVDSFDGSKAYLTTTAVPLKFNDQSVYTLNEFDMKFGENGSGIILKNSSGGKINSSFIMRNNALSQETGSGKYNAVYTDIDTSKWYHVQIMYKSEENNVADNVSMNLYEWNNDGTEYTKVYTGSGLNDRNGNAEGMIEVQTGTVIDNIKVFTPVPNEVTASVANTLVYSGETTQCTASVSWNGLPFHGADGITWSVLDQNDLPLVDGPIQISQAGVLTIGATASEQTIKVQAASQSGAKSTVPVEVKSSEIFHMKNIGINEETGHISKLYVEKKLPYDDDVVFVMAFYKDGILADIRTLKGYGSNYPISENVEIAVDWTIPDGFDAKENPNDTAKVFIWTSLS